MDACDKKNAEQRRQDNGDNRMVGSYSIQPSQMGHTPMFRNLLRNVKQGRLARLMSGTLRFLMPEPHRP